MTHAAFEKPFVVVGVDGSECSREALAFAVHEAELRGATLRIVSAWSVPAAVYAGALTANVGSGEFEQLGEFTSADALTTASELAPLLEIEATTPNEQPAAALLEASAGAALLVVGSRGRGGFARLLLGSVSEQVAHHATCPVAIVRT